MPWIEQYVTEHCCGLDEDISIGYMLVGKLESSRQERCGCGRGGGGGLSANLSSMPMCMLQKPEGLDLLPDHPLTG